MSGKNDDGCCDDSGGIKDDVAPMRSLGGSGPAGYSSGPTHVDRADFRECTEAEATATAEAEAAAQATPPKEESETPAG